VRIAEVDLYARVDLQACVLSQLSSQPPLLKCCDDRLNPPWVARSSRAMTAVGGRRQCRLTASRPRNDAGS
jgi:hypothetical protein